MTELNEQHIAIYHDIVFSYCEGLIPLRSFNEKKYGQNNLIWIDANKYTAIESITTFARNADMEESSALCIPGTVKERGQAKASEICEMQVLLVDIDCGDIEAKITYASNWLGAPSMIVESGGIIGDQKKLHAYWKLMESATGTDLSRLIEIRRVLALKIGGDEHFGSAHQPIRIAGTIYHKAEEPRLVNIRSNNDMEYNLWDLEDIIFEMPIAPFVTVNNERASLNPIGNNKLTVQELFRKEIRSGGVDEVSKFSALSTVIGFWLNRLHKQDVTEEEALEEIHSYNIARISPPWEKARLDDEINRLWKKHVEKYGEHVLIQNVEDIIKYNAFNLITDDDEDPVPYIKNGILPIESMLVFAGPPKIGKSHFILSLLVHMSLGVPYLDTFVPSRPLKIFYLQSEVKKPTLRKRLRTIEVLTPEAIKNTSGRLEITNATRVIFDDSGIQKILKAIKDGCEDNPPDVICIDPLRNLFFSGGSGDDNSVSGMKEFCRRISSLRDSINPKASIIMVHHTRKIDTKMMEEDPFNMIAGSGFLRGYYDTGIMFYRPSEKKPNNILMKFEIRDTNPEEPLLESMKLLKQGGKFIVELEKNPEDSEEKQTQKIHKELRIQQQLVELIATEAMEGRIYTIQGFAEHFENQCELPSVRTLIRKLNKLAELQLIRFFNNPEEYGLIFERRYKERTMFMCLTEMLFKVGDDHIADITPTHYKSAVDGSFCKL